MSWDKYINVSIYTLLSFMGDLSVQCVRDDTVKGCVAMTAQGIAELNPCIDNFKLNLSTLKLLYSLEILYTNTGLHYSVLSFFFYP